MIFTDPASGYLDLQARPLAGPLLSGMRPRCHIRVQLMWMNENELFALLTRAIRKENPDAQYNERDKTFTIRNWSQLQIRAPILLHVTPEALAAACWTDKETAECLWPGSSVQRAGFNLLLVALEEEISEADWRDRGRRLVVTPDGLKAMEDE